MAVAEGSGDARGVLDACAEFVVAFPPSKYRGTPIIIDGGHDGYSGHHLSPSCAYDQIQATLKRYYDNVTVGASRAAPTIESRLNQVNALFAYEMARVCSSCTNLIKSLERSSLKPGTWDLEKKRDDDYTHFADAFCAPLFRLTKDELIIKPGKEPVHGLNTVI